MQVGSAKIGVQVGLIFFVAGWAFFVIFAGFGWGASCTVPCTTRYRITQVSIRRTCSVHSRQQFLSCSCFLAIDQP